MSKIKIMVVDDHLVIREGLKQLLQIEDDITVIAEAGSGMEGLQVLENIQPDIVFMDIRMPGINGIETTRLICEKYPEIKVIMLTIYEDSHYVTEAMRMGAKGYILKSVKRDDLIKAIHHVMEGRAFLDPKVTGAVVQCLMQKNESVVDEGSPVPLTIREMEVLQHMVAGHSDRNTSKLMNISAHTVRSHIKNMYRKLGVSSKSQAVSAAFQKKIITSN